MIPIPCDQPITVKRLPWVSMALALAYLLVFFTLQSADRKKEEALIEWYQSSGQMALEWPNYISWLRISGQGDLIRKAEKLEEIKQQGDVHTVFRTMAFDPGFEEENRIRGESYWSDSEFIRWKDNRRLFEQKAQEIAQFKASLTPTSPRPSTYLTYHFLHENLLHLLLPMVLWFWFAVRIEAHIDWKKLPLLYMASGIVAGLAYVGLQGNSYTPMMGSTPIVSAAIGMYLAIFGLQKVSYVYFRARIRGGGWFDRFSAHGAWFALLWCLLPAFEWFMGSSAPNVWIAQTAGLLAGAALYHLTREQEDDLDEAEEELDEDEEERLLRQHLTAGWASMSAMEFNVAADMFKKALSIDKRNFNALSGLYHICKLKPDSHDFLKVTARALAVGSNDPGIIKQQVALLRDFKKRYPDETRLPLELRLQMIMRFSHANEFKDAESLFNTIIEHKETHQGVSKAAYSLASTFKELGNNAKASHYATLAASAEASDKT